MKFDDSTIDKLVTCTSRNPGALADLIHDSRFKDGIKTLFADSGQFTIRSSGIFSGMRSRKATIEGIQDALRRMSAVAPSMESVS